MQIFTYPIIAMKQLDVSVIRIAEVLKALGHPVRIEILRILNDSKNRRLTVKQIHESLEIAQPEASKHLTVLKNQNVLTCEKSKGFSFYRINSEFGLTKQLINFLKQ